MPGREAVRRLLADLKLTKVIHNRGYDEAVVSEGRILLLPRVPAPQIGRVRARLARVLAGQCSVSVLESSSARQRFDATG